MDAVVQFPSYVWLFATPWTLAHQAPLSSTISWSLLKFISIESMILSNYLILCYPFLLLPSVFPSIRIFSSELALCIRSPNCWSFSFSISPSNEYSGLISFRIDWFDLLAVQRTLRVFSSTRIQKHQFFTSQPSLWSNSYIHTWLLGKTIALTIWTFAGKVKSLLFNLLSRFVIAFLPRSNCLLILWLQSLSTVILEPKQRKSVTASTFPPSIYHEVMGLDAIILIFWMLNFKPAFHSPLSQSSRSSLVPLCFLPLEWYHLCNWGCWNFSQKSWF